MAQAKNVIRLPGPDFAFEGIKFKAGTSFLKKYRVLEEFIPFCQKFLEMGPEAMKEAFVNVSAAAGEPAVQNLISDFENCSKDLNALCEMFSTAAARMTIVKRGLV